MRTIVEMSGKIESDYTLLKDGTIKVLVLTTNKCVHNNNFITVYIPKKNWGCISKYYKKQNIFIRGVLDTEVLDNKTNIIVYATHVSREKFRKPLNYNPNNKGKWYGNVNNKNLVEINPIDVYLTNSEHLEGSIDFLDLNSNIKTIAVRDIGNEKYELVCGLSSYTKALLKREKVQAIVTDLSHEDFIKKYMK